MTYRLVKNLARKILAKLVIMQIFEAVDQQLRKEQLGFRKGERMHVPDLYIAQIIEQYTYRVADSPVYQIL